MLPSSPMTPSHLYAEDWDPGEHAIIDLDAMFSSGYGSSPAAAKEAKDAMYPAGEFLSPQDVSEIVGLHTRVIHRAVNEGEIEAYKLRGKIRIRRSDFEAWLAAHKVEPYSLPEFE